jgi:hypothetical protein
MLPDAPAHPIIVADVLLTTDFVNFVKIYLLQPIEKNRGRAGHELPHWLNWLVWAFYLDLAGLDAPGGMVWQLGRRRCSVVESEEHRRTRAHLVSLQKVH